MYVAAAICLWLLRAWKIGDMEHMAASEAKDVNGTRNGDSKGLQDVVPEKIMHRRKSSILKRLFVWKKV